MVTSTVTNVDKPPGSTMVQAVSSPFGYGHGGSSVSPMTPARLPRITSLASSSAGWSSTDISSSTASRQPQGE